MVEKKRNAIIPRPTGAIEKIGAGPKGILTRMVSDALASARSPEKLLTVAPFRIGNYEFRDADYRQILLWAAALALEPVGIIQRLESSKNRDLVTTTFSVENGSIVTLAWDFNLLPLPAFEWVDGLVIREIGFMGRLTSPPQISLRLPFLVRLECSGINLTELDLSKTPALTVLACSTNELTELDLSNVPGLDLLVCSDNHLTELDLSNVPRLTELWCHDNELTELDLSNVPELDWLNCQSNQLTELDIRSLEKLWYLVCDPVVTLKKRPTQNFGK